MGAGKIGPTKHSGVDIENQTVRVHRDNTVDLVIDNDRIGHDRIEVGLNLGSGNGIGRGRKEIINKNGQPGRVNAGDVRRGVSGEGGLGGGPG